MARTQKIWSIEAGTVKDQPTTLVADDNKTILNLSGITECEVLFKYSATDPDANARITKTIGNGGVTVIDPLSGLVTVHFLPADTANVTGPSQVAYAFAIRVFYSAGPVGAGWGKLFIVPTGFQATTP